MLRTEPLSLFPAAGISLRLAALSLGLLTFLLLGLGQPELFDVDEGAFAEATREMLSSGDWGHTTLNGADRFDKPMGIYWLQGLSATVLGLTEFALRLPSALATWLAALAVGHFVMHRWGLRAGVLAAVIHVTSFGSWAMAHAATADAVLGLCLMLSALDLWRYLETANLPALGRLGLWMGLGLLVKGPVAFLIPVASLWLSCLSARTWQPVWRALVNRRAWLAMLAVSLPWYAYAYWRHGQTFVDGFILKHNIDRFTAPMEGHAGSWFYFAMVAPLLWMPWSPLMLVWWGRWRDIWRDATTQRALIWTVFVFVFFSFSATKLPHYGIYAAPGVVVLLAATAGRMQAWHGWLYAGTWMVWHAFLVGLPLILMASPALVAQELSPVFMHAPQRISLLPILAVWMVFVAFIVFWRKRLLWLGHHSGVLSLMALIHATVLTLVVWPWWANTLQGPIKTLGLASRDRPAAVGQMGGNWPSFAFYRQQALLGKDEHMDVILMPESRLTAGTHGETLARAQGMVLFRPAKTTQQP
jgi:4-amino-4-deoxy-L-arabinose transferase-like glycosyltransferase